MKQILLLMTALCLHMAAWAQFAQAPAFPGAEGYGRYAKGGRGGKVYHVTNLSDDGKAGSLRYAVSQSGARIIVFDVSGTIHLQKELKISKDYITILGQTAPGDGICIADYAVTCSANELIIRYVRFRPGDVGAKALYAANSSYEGDDALGGRFRRNIIIDHCSISWSTDECCSFYGNYDFTLQWCFITESLAQSVHAKGSHGYGGIWGGERASFHHNLLADHNSRNPRFDHGYVSELAGPVDYINNVLYNWGSNVCYGGENKPGLQSKQFNMQNNYYRPGPATGTGSLASRFINPTTNCSNCIKNTSYASTEVVPGTYFIEGNVHEGNKAFTANNRSTANDAYKMDSSSPYTAASFVSKWVTNEKMTAEGYDYTYISLDKAEDALEQVLNYGGCSLSRDSVDRRIVREVRESSFTFTGSNGSKNGIIDSQEDVGGYPELFTAEDLTNYTDTDKDGIPDVWERQNGLNPNDASDAKLFTLDPKGWYTNIEVYANHLVEANITAEQRMLAYETFDEYYPTCKSNEGIICNDGSADRLYPGEPGYVDALADISCEEPSKLECYDILGRRLSAPVKGLNIINGKKVVIR